MGTGMCRFVVCMAVSLAAGACNQGGTSLSRPDDTAQEDFGPDARHADQTRPEPDGRVSNDARGDAGDLFVLDLPPEAVEPACKPGEGCFEDKCEQNGDCQSGWCVEHMGDGVCTKLCEEECPPGWTCLPVSGGPDMVYICVSDFSNLCKPCATTEGCKTPGGAQDVCVDYGQEGSFCGGACGQDLACPWGFSCKQVETVDGAATTQCVSGTGVCPCAGKSIMLALSTPCTQDNEFGSCAGVRVCAAETISPCDAPVPTQETCNGKDDDCDGDTDEPVLVGSDFVNVCDDGNACTEDLCDAETGCGHAPLGQGECVDGDACTVGDHCQDGTCMGSAVLCDDKNPCTDDSCDGYGGCLFANNAADCDDQDPCTVADECQAGQCHGFQVACDCLADMDCQKLEDGNACNGKLFCDKSVLPHKCAVVPGSVVACGAPGAGPDAICQKNECAPETGKCALAADHDGFACDDEDACTVGEHCLNGTCAEAVAAACNDGNPCTDDKCKPETGCVFTPNASACNDADACTLGDACLDGECMSGPPTPCDDGNVCNGAETCEPDKGCTPGKMLVCDDGNPCNGLETCHAKLGCQAGNPFDCDDGNVCNGQETCSPAAGCVAGKALPCDDGNACNGVETCDPAKGCQPGAAAQCDDGNPCTDDWCNPKSGCAYSNNKDACDDGNACTTGDHCAAGECVYLAVLSCDDADLCTDNTCDPAVGCVTTLNQAPCDDTDLCTTGDHCHLGKCISSGTLVCNDGNKCTDDACTPGAGCTFTPNKNPCDDGNACTTGDQCSNGWCIAAGILSCGDGNPCTDDACDPATGCTNVNNVLPCTDGNACTSGDACSSGSCKPGGPLNCADGDPCTDDSCNPFKGCEYAFNNAACTDANACTTGDTCVQGVCIPGAGITCDDKNGCTNDGCDPGTGCVFTPNTAACEDGNPCTLEDKCVNGACTPGAGVKDCNDVNDCTTDSCNAQSGCVHVPVADNTPCGQDKICSAGACVPKVTGSCQAIKVASPASPSGVYSIDTDGAGPAAPFQVYCEMSLDNGGWTLVMNLNAADGHKSILKDAIWTTNSESGSFGNRWTNDYKSLAASVVTGTNLLIIVRNHTAAEGEQPQGWRSWKLSAPKRFQDFFSIGMGDGCANASGGCNSGHSGDGRKQTAGVLSSGKTALYDPFTNQADEVYSNSYYGCCGPQQDGFRLSSHYRWANNSNVGLGLQMDNESDSTYSLEAGALLKKETYSDPQRFCCGGCGGCTAYPDGSNGYTSTKVSMGSDHFSCQCNVGVTYRFEWYVR